MMRKAPASDSRPMPTSWVRISEPFASNLQNLEEDEVYDTSQLSTFPTDQVPQPVTRDTIATTTMAASTDSRGSACLPQSAPTVQAQVSSTVAGCVSCDDCTHVNLNAKQHNQVETQSAVAVACDSRDAREAGAGPRAIPAAASGAAPSVIASSSCPDASTRPPCPNNLTPIHAGNSNFKSYNKMQSVNVISSTVSINYKGNDNCLLFECNTAVTVPNTKPQRNTDGPPRAAYNNSDKLAVVNVYDKNYGALNRSSMEPQSQCRLNQIPGDDIPAGQAPRPQKSEYLKSGNDTSDSMYNDDTSSDMTFERLVELTRSTNQAIRRGLVPPRALGLCGGGESSLSTGTAGWGTPPGTNANNNASNSSGWGSASANGQANPPNQQQWNNNQNRANPSGQGPAGAQDTNSNKTANQNSNLSQQGTQPQTSQANNQGWGQQPAKSQQGSGPPPASSAPAISQAAAGPASGTPTSSTKQQLEQLNNMREALFSQDGWGGQHVNQDTNWDIPSSPEPSMKMDGSGPPQWKPTVNNGTDLWELNLRNGGQPPPQPAQKTPWGHTPSTNIGGTWGEDDDTTDSSNVWTGVPNNQQQWSGNTAATAPYQTVHLIH